MNKESSKFFIVLVVCVCCFILSWSIYKEYNEPPTQEERIKQVFYNGCLSKFYNSVLFEEECSNVGEYAVEVFRESEMVFVRLVKEHPELYEKIYGKE